MTKENRSAIAALVFILGFFALILLFFLNIVLSVVAGSSGFRGMRLALSALFVATVIGVGLGIAATASSVARKMKEDEEFRACHPSEPWLYVEDWRDGKIHSSSKSDLRLHVIWAIVWNSITWPAIIGGWDQIVFARTPLVLLVFIFPIVGVALARRARNSRRRYQKYGESIFEMASVPGVIGGSLAGVVRMDAAVALPDEFEVKLSSVHRYTSGSGEDQSTRETVLRQESYQVAFDRARAGIPVSFRIPSGCVPTDNDDSDNEYLWRLELSADAPDVDYHAQFEVPVFATEDDNDRSILEDGG